MQSHNNRLGYTLEHARLLNRLDQILASLLDPGLAPHCQVAAFRDRCLILLCSNAAFATRIRMISQQLIESFADEGVTGIDQITLRVAPVNRPQPDVPKQRNLSEAAIQALGNFAKDSGDEEIQAIFDRIKTRRNEQ